MCLGRAGAPRHVLRAPAPLHIEEGKVGRVVERGEVVVGDVGGRGEGEHRVGGEAERVDVEVVDEGEVVDDRVAEPPVRLVGLEGHEHRRAGAELPHLRGKRVYQIQDGRVQNWVTDGGERVDLRGEPEPARMHPACDPPHPLLVQGADLGLQDAPTERDELRVFLAAVESIEVVDEEYDLKAFEAEEVCQNPPVLDQAVHRCAGEELGPRDRLLKDRRLGDLGQRVDHLEEEVDVEPRRTGRPPHHKRTRRGRGRGGRSKGWIRTSVLFAAHAREEQHGQSDRAPPSFRAHGREHRDLLISWRASRMLCKHQAWEPIRNRGSCMVARASCS